MGLTMQNFYSATLPYLEYHKSTGWFHYISNFRDFFSYCYCSSRAAQLLVNLFNKCNNNRNPLSRRAGWLVWLARFHIRKF